MDELNRKKNVFYYIGLASGLLAIALCLVTIGLSVVDTYYSIYILATALIMLGINRVGFHLSNFKKNMIENIVLTGTIFVLALLVSLTKFSIYFLISSMFCYSITIIIYCLLEIKKDRSVQMIVFHCLAMTFAFLFSFVFFFPSIYEKHATSVSNSNFIVLCYSALIIVSSTRNILFPYHQKFKINVIVNIIRKSLVKEILLGLLILVILCSVYFTIVEPNITSYVDALWYSFAVITTIGFGDVSVVTTLGRILSVILGICGIVVVALFTSFIVNFYNEMNKKREERTLQKLIKESNEENEVQKKSTENKDFD